jgi:hypothetical protein
MHVWQFQDTGVAAWVLSPVSDLTGHLEAFQPVSSLAVCESLQVGALQAGVTPKWIRLHFPYKFDFHLLYVTLFLW